MIHFEALKILGLNADATETEIRERFREMAGDRHPDRGGSNAEMVELLTARDVALDWALRRTALVPIETITAIVEAVSGKLGERAERAAATENASLEVVLKATGQLKRRRKISGIAAAIAAAALFLGKDIPAELFPQPPEITEEVRALPPVEKERAIERIRYMQEHSKSLRRTWLIGTFSIGIYAGVFAWFLTSRIARIEAEIKDFEEELSTKTQCSRFLKRVLGESLNSPWTAEQLTKALDDLCEDKEEPRRHLILEVGSSRLAHLVLTRCLQLQLLQLTESSSDGEFVQLYSLGGAQQHVAPDVSDSADSPLRQSRG